jgi:fatty acid desaturase
MVRDFSPPALLRNRTDLRAVAHVAFYYVLLAAEWIFAPLEWRVSIPLVALTALVSWVCAIITHNSLHRRVFKRRIANDAFQVALTCAYGFPVSEFVPGHNLSHHRHTQTPADLIRTAKTPFIRFNALNLIYFFPRVGFDIMRQNYRYVRRVRGRRPAWHRQLVIESVTCWALRILLFIVDWRKALIFGFIPHLLAIYGIVTVNLFQHDGCDPGHPFNHSRSFVGRLFNWLTFNNGYHAIHHHHPTMHWSRLAEAHAKELHGRVDPALEQPSLALYLLRSYVLSARRTRYDGTPLDSLDSSADEDWFPSTELEPT